MTPSLPCCPDVYKQTPGHFLSLYNFVAKSHFPNTGFELIDKSVVINIALRSHLTFLSAAVL